MTVCVCRATQQAAADLTIARSTTYSLRPTRAQCVKRSTTAQRLQNAAADPEPDVGGRSLNLGQGIC